MIIGSIIGILLWTFFEMLSMPSGVCSGRRRRRRR